ncbi:MAG: hypothetical protein R2849_11080 [Thermomicrobiales bacterium]
MVVDGEIAGWDVRADGGRVQSAGDAVEIHREQPGETALYSVVDAGEGLGYLTVEAQSVLSSGTMRAFLICQDERGEWLHVAPDGAGASVPNDGDWHVLRIAALCPTGTASARLDLRNAGVGTVDFRDAHLELDSCRAAIWRIDPDSTDIRQDSAFYRPVTMPPP